MDRLADLKKKFKAAQEAHGDDKFNVVIHADDLRFLLDQIDLLGAKIEDLENYKYMYEGLCR